MTGAVALEPIVGNTDWSLRQTTSQKGVNMTHDAETETAAAVIEDLLYLIPCTLATIR